MNNSINCKEVRKKIGLSQGQMGKAMNTEGRHISQWERGLRKPSGQAVRLMELLLELEKRNLMEWYYRKYGVKKG